MKLINLRIREQYDFSFGGSTRGLYRITKYSRCTTGSYRLDWLAQTSIGFTDSYSSFIMIHTITGNGVS